MITEENLRFPIITAVIHTYNHERYIAEAIESVMAQTIIKDVEVIVIDDCSTDGTTGIVKQYEAQHPEIFRVFRNPYNRQGVGYHPGSDALKTVRTKYVAFLDGDDYWTDAKKLEKQVVVLDLNPGLSGCAHATGIHNSVTSPTRYWQYTDGEQLVEFENLVQPKTPFHTSSFVMRSEYLRNFLSFYQKNPTCISGDLVLYAVAAANGPIAFSSQVMSVYRLHSDGITHGSVHRSTFSFIHNRLRMWLEIKSSLAIESEKISSLISAYQERVVDLFWKLKPIIVMLSDEEIGVDGRILKEDKRNLLQYFEHCEVVLAVKSDLTEALQYDDSNRLAGTKEVFFYKDSFQIIELLDALVRRGTETVILCAFGKLQIDRILKSISSNSAFVISTDIADSHRDLESKDEIFLCLNHRDFSLRFFDECRFARELDVENDFLRCARIALGKFNVASPDVVSVVN
jgi:glycosyltransferase involved in cell wall biosynthesis